MRRFAIALTCIGTLVGTAAAADCCRLVKTSAVPPLIEVRVCEAGSAEGCETALFVGALVPGDAHTVCAEAGTLWHQTYDDAIGGYGEPVEAACNGGDIEL